LHALLRRFVFSELFDDVTIELMAFPIELSSPVSGFVRQIRVERAFVVDRVLPSTNIAWFSPFLEQNCDEGKNLFRAGDLVVYRDPLNALA